MAWLWSLSLCFLISTLTFSHCYADNSQGREYGDLQRKYTMVVNEMEDMKETMKAMKNDMKRFQKISRALDNLCNELYSDKETPETTAPATVSESEHKTDESKALTPLQTVTVEKTNDTFQIEYHSAGKVNAKVKGDFAEDVSIHHVYSNGNGVLSGNLSSKGVRVKLNYANYYDSFLLFNVHNTTKVTLPKYQISTDVQGDIVFEPGQSTTVNVKTFCEESENFDFDFSYGMYTVNRNETERVFSTLNRFPGIINETTKKEHEYSVIINADKEDYEGLVYISLDVEMQKSPVSFYFSSGLVLEARRDDHLTPFPEGFLGFLAHSFMEAKQQCEIGTACLLYCTIVGNDPKDITLWRYTNGKHTELQIRAQKDHYYKRLITAAFQIANASKSDTGRYTCQGTSYSGTVIEKEFEAVVMIPYKIVRERSEVVKDGADEVIARCVGKGYPDPEIRFYNGSRYWDQTSELNERSGFIISRRVESDDIITATLTFNPQVNQVNQISCVVRQVNSEYPMDDFCVYHSKGTDCQPFGGF